jgi:hypothetical protein
MSLLRAIPRTMLASYFVAAGIKAIRDPESLVPAAEPLVDRVVPLVKEYTPEQVAGYVPENTVTWCASMASLKCWVALLLRLARAAV